MYFWNPRYYGCLCNRACWFLPLVGSCSFGSERESAHCRCERVDAIVISGEEWVTCLAGLGRRDVLTFLNINKFVFIKIILNSLLVDTRIWA